MKITVKPVENPNCEFWIWNRKITNKQDTGIYPSSISNVGSGQSVAVFQEGQTGNLEQIAQLQLPDYEKLLEYYSTGKEISLDYTYIDNFMWLGDKKPYEVESLPYVERKSISARCSIFNNDGNENYVHIMQSYIQNGDLDFSYTGFYNLNIDFCNLTVGQGNLRFSNARFFDASISANTITCGGNIYFPPEIDFSSIKADTLNIHIMLMSQLLSINFLCAKTINTTITLDPSPKAFHDVCFVKSTIDVVNLVNAEIDSLDIRDAQINYLKFKQCIFSKSSQIAGDIRELHIEDSLNSTVCKLSFSQIEKLTFAGTINNGKFLFTDFATALKAIQNLPRETTKDTQQYLMLRENFRQTGENEPEDICYRLYQKFKTKQEKNVLKKASRMILDITSGYGTKPVRMLVVILLSIVLFGTLYYYAPCLSYQGVNTWLEHVYASGITFFAVGYGDLFPQNILTKMISLVEAFLGVTATSYFLVVLSRKIIR